MLPNINNKNNYYSNIDSLSVDMDNSAYSNKKKFQSAARLKNNDQVFNSAYNQKIDQFESKRKDPSFKNASQGMGGVLS